MILTLSLASTTHDQIAWSKCLSNLIIPPTSSCSTVDECDVSSPLQVNNTLSLSYPRTIMINCVVTRLFREQVPFLFTHCLSPVISCSPIIFYKYSGEFLKIGYFSEFKAKSHRHIRPKAGNRGSNYISYH